MAVLCRVILQKTTRCHISADRSVNVRLFRLPVQNSSSGVDHTDEGITFLRSVDRHQPKDRGSFPEDQSPYVHMSTFHSGPVKLSLKKERKTDPYRGADKSLARLGRKQARKHVRDARDFNNIEFASCHQVFSCKARRRRKFRSF